MAGDLPSNLSSLTVAQLKKELKERNLTISGKKADLVARLSEWCEAQVDEDPPATTEEAPVEEQPPATEQHISEVAENGNGNGNVAVDEPTAVDEEALAAEKARIEEEAANTADTEAADEAARLATANQEAADKAAADKAAADKIAAEQAAADKAVADKVAADKAAADKAVADKAAADKAAADKAAANKAAADKAAADKAAADKASADKIAADKAAADKAAADEIAADKAAADKAVADKIAADKAAAAKVVAAKAATDRQLLIAAKKATLAAADQVKAKLDAAAKEIADKKAEEQAALAAAKPKKKHKKKKKKGYNEPIVAVATTPVQDVIDPKDAVMIEYVSEVSEDLKLNPEFSNEFNFDKFSIEVVEDEAKEETTEKVKAIDSDADDEDMEEEEESSTMSKKKLRKLNRLTVSELKQLVKRPDVVEIHDVTAADPKLLVLLKAARNTVPIPKHWAQKRKYLQGKRGIEKPPFQLPDYIVNTGIMDMREALAEKEERMGLKAKQREKTRPKMGKIDIDYEKLHDAFFRYQTKPKMTIHGELYYEGKEFETTAVDKKPGELTDELRAALGMPVGEDAAPIPPPWLLHMQRYGPPPSYPNLKIPGLNAKIPDGAKFGYHAGGWGKPPVDEYGRPLYGNVFSNEEEEENEAQITVVTEEVSKEVWGELASEEEASSEEEDEEEDEDAEGQKAEVEDSEGTVTPSGYTSETPSGITSVTGVDTPSNDALELRKRRQIEDAMDDTTDQALFKVLPQKAAVTGGMMGSQHIYDMATAVPAVKKGKKIVDGDGVEMAAADPDMIANMDQEQLQKKYAEMEAAKEAEKPDADFSDMVARHTATAAKKRKAQSKKDAAVTKKFKF